MNSALPRGKHDKDERRRALVHAATRTFADKGYDQATTREVAEYARCSEGLIHRYFGGKRGLLLAILEEHGQGDGESHAIPLHEDLREELEALLLWSLDHHRDDADFMRVSVGEAIVDPLVAETIRDQIAERRVALIAQLLERHRAAGRIRPGVDLVRVAAGLSALMFSAGFMHQIVFQMEREELRQRARVIADVIARGIAPDPSSETPAVQGALT